MINKRTLCLILLLGLAGCREDISKQKVVLPSGQKAVIECPISPYIYIDFREWLIGLEIDHWEDPDFEQMWQKYSSYNDTKYFSNATAEKRFEVLDRHRFAERSIYDVSEVSVESCNLNRDDSISRYFYKIKNRAYIDDIRLLVAFFPNGKINHTSLESKSTAVRMDEGRIYKKLRD